MHSKILVEKLHSFIGHTDCVYSLEVSNDPRFFFSAGGDGLVVKWDLHHPEFGEVIAKVPNSIYALHFLCEQSVVVAGQNYEGIHVLDWQNNKELKSIKLSNVAIFDIKSYKDQLFIASGDGSLTIVDIHTWTILSRIIESSKSARAIAINHLTYEVAIGYSDHFIRVFDLRSYKKKHEWKAHQNSVFTLAYSTNHKTLLSGSRDARIKNWDVENGYQLKQEVAAHLYAINHLAFSPDGNYVASGSMDKAVKIWKNDELQLLKVVDKARHSGHGTSVNKLLWINSGLELLSASDDRLISHWKFKHEIQ